MARRHARRSRQPLAAARVDYNRGNALATLDRRVESRAAYGRAAEVFEAEGAEALVALSHYAIAGIDLLGGITGETASLDILDTIFNNFCIGK